MNTESKVQSLTVEQQLQLKVLEESFQKLNKEQLSKLMLTFIKQSMLQDKIQIMSGSAIT